MASHSSLEVVVAGLAEAGQQPVRGKDAIAPAVAAGPAIGQAKGTGYGGAAKNSGGGIASPLTETLYSVRTYHPETSVTSTDGVFTLNVKRIKTINFKDANNNAVQIELKAPV